MKILSFIGKVYLWYIVLILIAAVSRALSARSDFFALVSRLCLYVLTIGLGLSLAYIAGLVAGMISPRLASPVFYILGAWWLLMGLRYAAARGCSG